MTFYQAYTNKIHYTLLDPNDDRTHYLFEFEQVCNGTKQQVVLQVDKCEVNLFLFDFIEGTDLTLKNTGDYEMSVFRQPLATQETNTDTTLAKLINKQIIDLQ